MSLKCQKVDVLTTFFFFSLSKFLINHECQSITLSNCQDINHIVAKSSRLYRLLCIKLSLHVYRDCFLHSVQWLDKELWNIIKWAISECYYLTLLFFLLNFKMHFLHRRRMWILSPIFLHLTKGSLWSMYRMNDYSDSTPVRKKMGKTCEKGAMPLILHAEWSEGCQGRTDRGGLKGVKQNRKQQPSKRGETDTTLCL